MPLPLVRGLPVLALLLGGAASAAEADLLPPVAQLFAWNATPVRAAGPTSCSASQAAALPMADARRRAALARIAALVGSEPGGVAEPLNGRGYAYPVERDPASELRRVVLEARRQREAAAHR